MSAPNIAVFLSGCGVYDGAEIHESVLTMLAIARHGAAYQCFAPNVAQYHVVNHLTGEEEPNATRNVLVEAARIARGNIKDVTDYSPADFDALILPGGFGVAKNFCTFAVEGPNCTVNGAVEKAIRDTHAAKRPIGALCIAPALMARILGDVTVTIGSDAGVIPNIEAMGAHHTLTTHGEVVIDTAARLATTPCYMLEATLPQIAEGTDNIVRAVLEMIGEAP